MKPAKKNVPITLAIGLFGFVVLPWYALEESLFAIEWLPFYPFDPELAPAWLQAIEYDRPWLWGVLPFLAVPSFRLRCAKTLLACGVLGLGYLLVQGYAIGALGPNWSVLEGLEGKQYGLGFGGLFVAVSFVLMITNGLAMRGVLRGDSFVLGALGLITAAITTFVFVPVSTILVRAVEDENGQLAWSLLETNVLSGKVWGAGGVAWNSLGLAIATGVTTTVLGLIFALLAVRTRFPGKRWLRALTVLPIITPPFVIGLALILIFGRAGLVTGLLDQWFGIEPSRYIFGFWGIFIAQVLAFTPIAFLVVVGVVEGIDASVEEAAQTLGASRFQTFVTVTLPLMRPGLANAFLLGFIESLADFGNPIVLGGSYDVLSTEIYFAVAGAQGDIARAAGLAIVLLTFTLAAFYAQRRWVGRAAYTATTGKATHAGNMSLPRGLKRGVYGVALTWIAFTVFVYGMIIFGGFVENFGHDHSFTLAHYRELFSPTDGVAYASLWTTIKVATVAAPLTAALGILTAYLLARVHFRGHAAFEFGAMLSFAIPGTVIGVSYILAFNVPPIEMTGTGVILVACFVFRNMPVGIRAGLASLSQIDETLDEASLTLGGDRLTTIRKVILPLIRPAIVAALVYGFVRAMTAVSAVVFLVSAEYDLSTTYILGRVEAGEYGPSIAYSSVLIVFMLLVVASIQLLVGRRADHKGVSS